MDSNHNAGFIYLCIPLGALDFSPDSMYFNNILSTAFKTLINTGYTFDEFLDDSTIAYFKYICKTPGRNYCHQ